MQKRKIHKCPKQKKEQKTEILTNKLCHFSIQFTVKKTCLLLALFLGCPYS